MLPPAGDSSLAPAHKPPEPAPVYYLVKVWAHSCKSSNWPGTGQLPVLMCTGTGGSFISLPSEATLLCCLGKVQGLRFQLVRGRVISPTLMTPGLALPTATGAKRQEWEEHHLCARATSRQTCGGLRSHMPLSLGLAPLCCLCEVQGLVFPMVRGGSRSPECHSEECDQFCTAFRPLPAPRPLPRPGMSTRSLVVI